MDIITRQMQTITMDIMAISIMEMGARTLGSKRMGFRWRRNRRNPKCLSKKFRAQRPLGGCRLAVHQNSFMPSSILAPINL